MLLFSSVMKKHTLAIPTTAEHQNMLTFLPPLLKGVLSASLLLVNTLVMCCPLLFLSLFKLIIPVPAFRQIVSHFINSLAEGWISCNSTWMRYTQKLDYTVEGFENLDPNGWYLVIANHQSWADITIMQHLLNKKIPLMKFFLKKCLVNFRTKKSRFCKCWTISPIMALIYVSRYRRAT